MRSATLRSMVFFVAMTICITAIFFDLNKILIIYSLLAFGWLFFTGLATDIVNRINKPNEKSITNQGKSFDLTSFRNAVAQELMIIRSDLIKIRLNQDNYSEDTAPPPLLSRKNYETPGEWSHAKTMNEFFHMWLFCRKYPANFLCELYSNPDKSWGRIIIILDDIYPHDLSYNSISRLNDFDDKKLIKMHSEKFYTIKKDDTLRVLLCEYEISYPISPKNAKVLSVKKDDRLDYYQCILTLEINIESEKWVRKININSTNYCGFIFD